MDGMIERRFACEYEHQGALRDATEPAYNVAKPWLTVLDNSLCTADFRIG